MKPNPFANCARCLYRLGFGYDRISRRLQVGRRKVAKWILPLKKIGPSSNLNSWNQVRHKRTPRPPGPDKRLSKWNRSTRTRKKYLRRKLWAFFKHGLYPGFARIVGCSRSDFLGHLISQFKHGMTIENYGQKWELDHKTPCSKFDLANPRHVKICFHFTNIQPLRKTENRRKSSKSVLGQSELPINSFSSEMPV